MARLNPILQARMENLETEVIEEVSDEQAQAFEEGQELAASEKAMDDAHDDLSAVEAAVSDMEKLQEAQEKNVQIMEGTVSEEVPASEPESQPVEGEVSEDAEVNEAVMSEPLPENEDQAVEVIDEQIQNEELVMESIAASLGFKAKFGNSATKQLYAGLGIRTSKKSRSVGMMESRNASAGTKKARAIQAYKSHCEGIGDAVKKLGGAAWDGIKKFIQSIIDFVKLMVSGFGSIEKNVKAMKQKASEIKRSINNYDLSDEMKKGLTKVNPATLIIDLVNPPLAMFNAKVINGIFKSIPDINKFEEFFDGLYGNTLKFKTAKFKNVDGIGLIASNGIGRVFNGAFLFDECESISAKFGEASDAVDFVLVMADQFTKDGKEYMNDANAVMSTLDKLKKELDKLENAEDAGFIKKALQQALKAAKESTSAPKYVVSAMGLALKHIVSKKGDDKSETPAIQNN